MSVERIVAAAVALADEQGLDAVSMSRVAKQLDSSPMSLYRYVASKDELVALMVDAAYGPVPAPAAGEDWRAGLARWARGLRAAARAHPWAARVPIEGLPVAPNAVAWFDAALAALARTRLPAAQRASVVLLLGGYVRNHVTVVNAVTRYTTTMRGLIGEERFPALRALLDAGVLERADPPDEDFAFGLDRILDGVAALVEERGGKKRKKHKKKKRKKAD